MKRRRRLENLTILVISLVLSTVLAVNNSAVQTIHLNEFEEFSIKEEKGGKAYHQAQLQEIEKGLDLVVQLNNQSIEGDPDLNVHLDLETDTKPTIKDKPYCSSDLIGYDVCIINSKDIKENQKILVEVVCDSPCKYSLNLIYKKRIEYVLSDETKDIKSLDIVFKEDEIREVLIKIPTLRKDSKVHIQAVFQNIFAFNYTDISGFKMFANSGKDAPEIINNSQFVSMWVNENTICIPLGNQDLDSKFYSVAIKAPKNAVISFTAERYESERSLYLGDPIVHGVLKEGESMTFTLDLEDIMPQERQLLFEGVGKSQKFIANFMFNLIPYTGNPDLSVYYGKNKPTSLQGYSWESTETLNQDLLLINAEQLNKIGYNPDYIFYINIFAKETTSFELRLDVYSKNSLSEVSLQQGQPVSGFVEKNQIMNYELRVEGNLNREIEIILKSLKGNTDLFVARNDNYSNSQPISADQIQNFYDNGPLSTFPFIGWSVNKQGADIVKIQYNVTDCQNNLNKRLDVNQQPRIGIPEYFYCSQTFKIAVIGKDAQNTYTIKAASRDPDTLTTMREGDTQYLFMEQHQNRYFVFKPHELDQIESISFQLQFSNGFAAVAADRNFTKLKLFQQEKDYSTSHSEHQVSYNSSDLVRMKSLVDYEYYVRVQSFEKTQGSLVTVIKRKGEQEISYELLILDSPTILKIKPRQNGYFSFFPSYFGSTTIVAKANEEIKMYVGSTKYIASTKEKNIFDADKNLASTDRVKRIHFEGKDLDQDKDNYYGTIQNLSDKEIKVEIRYQSDDIYINFNESIEDVLFSKSKRRYLFNIYQELKNEQAYVYVLASGFVLEQKIKGGFYINDVLVEEFKDSQAFKIFELGPGTYKKHCPFLFNNDTYWQQCQLSIEVISEREERLTVSINIPSQPNYLHYEGSTLSQIPLRGEVRKFVYFVFDLQEIILNVQSFSYNIQVLGKIHTQDRYYNQNGKEFAESADDNKLSIRTEADVSHQIRIHPQTFKGEQCNQGCFIAISVILEKNQAVTDEKLIGNMIKLNISGDKIYDLYEGEISKGEVKKDDMIYYRVYVPLEKAQEKLIVSLTPLNDGDPDLFLNKDSSKLPTRKEFDLSSQDVAGDFIQVDNQSFKDEHGNPTGIAGYYIVGVYGVSNSVFTIQFQTGKYRIQKIESNQVQQVSLEENSIHYFIFHKHEKGHFTVVTNVLQGSSQDLFIFLKEFNEDSKIIKDYLQNIVDPNSSDLTTKYASMKDVLRYTKTDCDSCVYVIGVKNTKKVAFSASVNLDGGVAQIQNNKQQLVYLLQNKPLLMRFYSNDNFNLYITSISGQCIDAKVTYSYGVQSSAAPIQSKICDSSDPTNNLGYSSFQLEVTHPDKKSAQEGAGLFYASIFTIELLSKLEEAKVIVQGVTGGHARLIVSSVPLTQQVSKANNVTEFLYFTSYEDLQAVQVHISPESGDSDQLEQLQLRMVVADTGKHVYQQQIALTPNLLSKSFLTSRSQSYLLRITYLGTQTFKFSILLKESNKQSIHILDGTVMDVLPHNEVSNYVIYAKPFHQVLIQNFNCQNEGQNVYVYTNSTDLLAQNQQTQSLIQKSSSNHQVHIAKIDFKNEGAIFIQKRANKGSSDSISKSIITATDFLRNEPIIYDYVQTGGSGVLISLQDRETIHLVFSGLQCISSGCEQIKNLSVQSVEYSIYFAKEISDLHRLMNCEIKEDNDLPINEKMASIEVKGKDYINQGEILFSIDKSDLPKNNDKIYVGVAAKVTVASVLKDTPNRQFRFIYNELFVNYLHPDNLLPESGSSHGAIITISILGVIALLVALVLLYRKYTQVTNKLKYEMTDVRNIAHSSDMESNSIPDMKQYSAIIPQKESELAEMQK